MALCGTGLSYYARECVDILLPAENRSARLSWPSFFFLNKPRTVRCFSSPKSASPVESEDNSGRGFVGSIEQEGGPVTMFKYSDFKILDSVSSGIGGRADEIVYEATVKNSSSSIYGKRVVLRQLITAQAQRRGMRSIEVLKRLARRMLLYHSYSMPVHGYMYSTVGEVESLTLVHGYHGSFSLRHWLQQSDWIPTLEATLALNEASVRRVGDHKVGGPAVTRQLRVIRILMRDLLIGVNYLHSHGLAHTELRLENVHISPVDRHIKVGIFGNAADFYDDGDACITSDNASDRRRMMIAFDMRCVGFMMAKMVLRELMDPQIFAKFKAFLVKGNDPSCLREFLLPLLCNNISSANIGLQLLDRNWGAGWHLLSLLLATKPMKRISCLEALRHPFLCGPRWRVSPSMEMIRWGLGSTVVRITEEYIYSHPQRKRLAYFIESMEMLNPNSKLKNWVQFLPGKWRLLYSTGRHIGLTLRQPPARPLIGNATLQISSTPNSRTTFSSSADVSFTLVVGNQWPHDKAGVAGTLTSTSQIRLNPGKRQYIKEEGSRRRFGNGYHDVADSLSKKRVGSKWRKAIPLDDVESSVEVVAVAGEEIEVTVRLDEHVDDGEGVVREVRLQIPPEMFDLSKLVCGTYVDSRLLVIRAVSGSALLFTRTFDDRLRS